MMQAVRDAAQAMGHPASALHFEFFQADPTSSHGQNNQSFEIELSRSGKVVHVAAGQSALDALEEADVIVPSVCREGVCGTCECDVISGEVDHRDTLLSNEEKAANQTMMLCVSRAKGARLVLDL
jgi:vanillate O-demethylase ferredoxin subunit